MQIREEIRRVHTNLKDSHQNLEIRASWDDEEGSHTVTVGNPSTSLPIHDPLGPIPIPARG